MLTPEFCREQLATALDGLETGNLVGPRVISTGSWENFVVLTRTLTDLRSWDSAVAEDILTHEGQHLWVANRVAAEVLRFQITIDPDMGIVEPAVVTGYFEHHTSTHRAAVSAYPTEMSDGDTKNMQDEGFGTVDELVEAVVHHNQVPGNQGDIIPLPLSHQLASGFVERIAYL